MDKEITSGNVLGIGIDLVDVKRISNMLEKYPEQFLSKTFRNCEISECENSANKAERLAARFAAKEAMAKALGTGFRDNITLKSFWVETNQLGAPIARFDENVRDKMSEKSAKDIYISLTHIKDYAQAIAILVS